MSWAAPGIYAATGDAFFEGMALHAACLYAFRGWRETLAAWFWNTP